ncbi:MAG TPA: MarR family winged helix-turn-helix transcriptional regulator [Usitatibacter sp.]|nr:MarR family winged helix-turn-helix transcriptional regulator [Usitatibacter sp.]
MGTHTSASASGRGQEDIGRALDGLRAIVRALRLNSHALERRIGLSGAQLFVLQQLAEEPARSMNELAERTLTHQSSVSVVVSRLVERGLVTRSASVADARRTEIALSARGRAMLRRAPVTVQSQLVAGLRKLPPARLRALAAGIEGWIREAGIESSRPPLLFEEAAPARPAGKRSRRARE